MITIEISGKDTRIHKKRINKIIAQLPKRTYFHFLYEPELIIRVKNKDKHYITEYLDKKRWKYKTYKYPFPKTGYGETKKAVTYKYSDEFLDAMWINSKLDLKINEKEKLLVNARMSHLLLNTFGYNWLQEAIIHQDRGMNLIKTIKKYDNLSPIATLMSIFIIYVCRFNIFLMKSL